MVSYSFALAIALIGGLSLIVVTYGATGSFVASLVVLAVIGIFVYLLSFYGYIQIDTSQGELDIKFFETAPAPSPTKSIIPEPTTAMPIHKKEVFYVSGNNYTYDDAPAVCAAYEAELATYDQVNEAYSSGAEWCGYGWTQGGMALFPTQTSTWEALQQEVDVAKKTSCGRPGINGGYFNPNTMFGVNCYGIRPANTGDVKLPVPLPSTDPSNYNNLVNKFKSMLSTMTVSPFNRTEWSEWNGAKDSGVAHAKKDVKKDF
jgi:hypothetical protein